MILHCLRFLARIDKPETQVTDRELAMLKGYAHGLAVEIGCYEGRTAAALAPYCNTLYSIDPFIKGRLGIAYGEIIARRHVRRSKLTNVRFMKGMSWDVAPNFTCPIDFLFIDADHSDEGISRDWADWYPKVVRGGIVALHDAHIAKNSPITLGTHRFVEQLDHPITDAVDSLVILVK